MKKVILIWIVVILCIFADESMIDRNGYHAGIGGTALVFRDTPFVLPAFDLTLEYGITEQSTFLLEHQGYFIGGIVSLEYKYYMQKSVNTLYVMGGVIGAYVVDYGVEANTGVLKMGLGYAWNHLESDIALIGNATDIVPVVSVRYKF